MASRQKPLSEIITVGKRFLRSVNLEKDFSADMFNGDYIVTSAVREVLYRIVEGLEPESPSRAWTVTGPYGVGKSAFGVFLSRLFAGSGGLRKKAGTRLLNADPALAHKISDCSVSNPKLKGFLPILVTARRAPAPVCLAESIASSLSKSDAKNLQALGRKIGAMKAKGDIPDSRSITKSIDMVNEAARKAHYAGVMLIVDELGKLFEYAASEPQKGDVFVLQELAEQAVRSGDFPFVFIGLLHQSFEEYGRHLDITTRREWAKIHGRFEDISFIEPAEQVIQMVSEAIVWNGSRSPLLLSKKLRKLASIASRCGVLPPGMNRTDFEEAVIRSYPLHPVTLVSLPYLFRRFAQNERTLFSYLSSMEPRGFQEFLKTNTLDVDKLALIRLEDLFDYFTSNFGSGLFRHPHARRWMEASDALERKNDLGEGHQRLVKSIGILNALGEFCHLSAQEAIIACTVDDHSSVRAATKKTLQNLRDRSLLTYRSFNNTYRIWEGSDVDIEERVAEGERRLRNALNLAETVQRYLPPKPIVARRHSFNTGALRFFEIRYIDSAEEISFAKGKDRGADGQIFLCLSESGAVADKFRSLATEASDRQDVVFAIPQQIGELRSAATELAALRWAWENTPELRDDRVARRELALRITEAEQVLMRNLHRLLDPRPEPAGSGCLWFSGGNEKQVASPADVSHLLSHVCDALYPKTPRILNELIVRRSVSAAAASARRNLIEAMLLRSNLPLLGIDGFPPERSMYESVLQTTGLHQEATDETWRLVSPSKKNEHNLYPVWDFMESQIFSDDPQPVRVDALFEEMGRPPYGVMPGLHPILLCAFMLAYEDETTMYREGTFLPEPAIADYEVLIRRPELFAVSGCRVTGSRVAVVKRLAEGLGVNPATVLVVRALFRLVKSLPEMAWRTRRLPVEVLALRDAFDKARSPERLLFFDLPTALGLPAFSAGKLKQREIEEFFTALNSSLEQWASYCPETIANARDILLKACGFPPGEEGWELLRVEALRMESTITEPQLLAFVKRVTQAGTGSEGVETVLALVANRPHASWMDSDVERFADAAKHLGGIFAAAARSSDQTPTYWCRIDDLKPAEKKQAESLITCLRSELDKMSNIKSPRVVQAALAAIAEAVGKGRKSDNR